MPLWGELLVGLVIVIGLIGIVIPIIPGSLLIFGAIAVWAIVVGGSAWWVLAAVAAIMVGGEAVKYLVGGRVLRSDGIPGRTIIVGVFAGIVGFFVIPVIGLFIGFIVGALVSELVRTQQLEKAWRGAVSAAKAAAYTIGIDLLFGLIVTSIWLVSVILG